MLEDIIYRQLTWLSPDFPVNPIAGSAIDAGNGITVTCGPRPGKYLVSYYRDTQSWRMFPVSLVLIGDNSLGTYSGTWPTSGMMRNGTVSQRKPWVQRIDDPGYSLWPTPTASEAKRARFCNRPDIFSRAKEHGILKGRFTSGAAGYTSMATMIGFGLFPTPMFFEWMMGFPPNWTRPDCQ